MAEKLGLRVALPPCMPKIPGKNGQGPRVEAIVHRHHGPRMLQSSGQKGFGAQDFKMELGFGLRTSAVKTCSRSTLRLAATKEQKEHPPCNIILSPPILRRLFFNKFKPYMQLASPKAVARVLAPPHTGWPGNSHGSQGLKFASSTSDTSLG